MAENPETEPLPEHLSPASRQWARAVLSEREFSPAERELVCQAGAVMDRIEGARVVVAKDGHTLPTSANAHQPHPAATIEHDNRVLLLRLFQALGLVPTTKN